LSDLKLGQSEIFFVFPQALLAEAPAVLRKSNFRKAKDGAHDFFAVNLVAGKRRAL